MGRSGYTDDGDDEYGRANLWQANVERATKGKRGQRFFRELVAALDAMPEKRLIQGLLEDGSEVCALGALRRFKSLPEFAAEAEGDDPDWDELGEAFKVAPMITQEVMFNNDDDFAYHRNETPEARWRRMRDWAAKQITEPR